MTGIYSSPEGLTAAESVRAFIYARQSKRRVDESEASTKSQIARCTALIQSKPWTLAGVFEDVGKSGWDPETERTEFLAMMRAVRNREVDVVVIFSLSRLTRQGAMEAMRINEEFTKYGVRLISVEEPFLDTTHPIGVAIFALIAALAQQESDLKSAFISEAKAELKAIGGHVSGPPPFGMTTERVKEGDLVRTRLIPDGETKDVTLELATRVLEGESVSAVVRSYNERSEPSPGARAVAAGKKRPGRPPKNGEDKDRPLLWEVGTALSILRHPALAGFDSEWKTDAQGKNRKRVVKRDKEGRPRVVHVGIMESVHWYQLQDVLDGNSQATRQPRNPENERKLLGGWGILLCGVCGANMVYEDGQDRYTCPRPTSRLAPHGLTIKASVADDASARLVWNRLIAADPMNDEADREWLAAAAVRYARQHDLAGLEEERAEVAAQLKHVQDSTKELYADRRDGLYRGPLGKAAFVETLDAYTEHEQRCSVRLAEIDEQTTSSVVIPAAWTEVGYDRDPLGPGSLWHAWDVVERRSFLGYFVDSFTARPSTKRGRAALLEDRLAVIQWARIVREDADEENPEAEEVSGTVSAPSIESR